MDWTNILKVLKIPLKILLPATCLFSGILLFSGEKFLIKTNLLHFSNKNGFVFGLLFLISLCLICVYLGSYFLKWTKYLYTYLNKEKECFKTIVRLDWAETEILATLYKTYGHTDVADFNEPIIKGLLNRNLISIGGQQLISPSAMLEYEMLCPVQVMLQPIVWQSLDKYLPKVHKDIYKEIKK